MKFPIVCTVWRCIWSSFKNKWRYSHKEVCEYGNDKETTQEKDQGGKKHK